MLTEINVQETLKAKYYIILGACNPALAEALLLRTR